MIKDSPRRAGPAPIPGGPIEDWKRFVNEGGALDKELAPGAEDAMHYLEVRITPEEIVRMKLVVFFIAEGFKLDSMAFYDQGRHLVVARRIGATHRVYDKDRLEEICSQALKEAESWHSEQAASNVQRDERESRFRRETIYMMRARIAEAEAELASLQEAA